MKTYIEYYCVCEDGHTDEYISSLPSAEKWAENWATTLNQTITIWEQERDGRDGTLVSERNLITVFPTEQERINYMENRQ